MSLRAPTEHENGGISLRVVLPATRHSRARGNPGDGQSPSYRWKTVSRLRGWGWTPVFTGVTQGLDTRFSLRLIRPMPCGGFAGMTEPSGPWTPDGAKRNSGSSFYRLSPHRYFLRRARRFRKNKTPNFVPFVSFVVNQTKQTYRQPPTDMEKEP